MNQNSLGGAADLRTDDSEIIAAKQAARKKYKIMTVCISAVLVIAVCCLIFSQLGNRDIDSPSLDNMDTGSQIDGSETNAQNETTQNLNLQVEWSDWVDSMPSYVNDKSYVIEEQILYRSRNLETTSSTTQSTMDGWELYDTIEGTGDFGNWSDWSAVEVGATDTREVERQTRYRYRDKETTTGSSSTMAGWTLYDTEKSFGSWSEWSDTPLTANGTLDVETRQVENGCRYEMGHWCAVYTDGFPGGSCSLRGPHLDDELAANHLGDQQFHSIGWFTSSSSTPEPSQVTSTPCSRGWDIYTATNIETIYKTQYRSRSITTTYYYYRWKDWSAWSANAVSQTNNRQVETMPYYRYRDRVTVTTYYFKRWGNWSNYTITHVAQSDTVDVETKTQYRYKSK